MFMDDFMMFRCTLEYSNQLGIVGTLFTNSNEKMMEMGSPGYPDAVRGTWRERVS